MLVFSCSASWLSIFLLLHALATRFLYRQQCHHSRCFASWEEALRTLLRLSDLGKLVVVVEQKDQLRGYTQTYTDPSTGGKIDYGVVVWYDLPIVRNYFARLNVSLVYRVPDNTTTQYFDLTNGKLDTSYVPAPPQDLFAAFLVHTNQLALYSYLDAGFYLPSPPMMDFLFGFAQGMGDLLNQPTLYVVNFGADVVTDILATFIRKGFLTTAVHNNHILYANAATVPGKDVLFNSTIVAVGRSNPHQVKVLVNATSTGPYTLLECDTIMMTIPPKLDNLNGWDLSHSQLSLFGQFINKGYYAGILRNSGIPNNVTIFNKIAQTSVPGLVVAIFGANQIIPNQQVQQQILSDVKQLQVAGKGRSHPPFELTVPTAAIAGGFYQQLYGLQGTRNTFYTGSAWYTQDSSLLWQFTEALLSNITAN
ncbi:hypothetical protein BDZ45DRAFT_753938 [Acephala macrosclerotiorum]|nr:hypothetical protein BDZ45DRAFT_753938 [Acephala macrosclerotiorum]